MISSLTRHTHIDRQIAGNDQLTGECLSTRRPHEVGTDVCSQPSGSRLEHFTMSINSVWQDHAIVRFEETQLRKWHAFSRSEFFAAPPTRRWARAHCL